MYEMSGKWEGLKRREKEQGQRQNRNRDKRKNELRDWGTGPSRSLICPFLIFVLSPMPTRIRNGAKIHFYDQGRGYLLFMMRRNPFERSEGVMVQVKGGDR